MSWTDFYRRRDAIELVLAEARKNQGAGLPFDELPAVTEIFTDRAELALALQYKWSQILLGRIAAAQLEAGQNPRIDNVEVVAIAWRTATTLHPELRTLLDEHAAEAGEVFRAEQRAEQRMLALAAGLAEAGEPTGQITRIGAAFLALIRSGAPRPARRLAASS
jgi:hypothetical protein